MVGLVLVSHSRALAEAVLTLVRAMTGPEVPIAIAAGTGENHLELGTDAMEIYAAIESVSGKDGVMVLMDMGSAVLSAEMALDFLDESVRQKVILCPSSFVEGAVAAGVSSKIGGSLDDVYREASSSLTQKEQQIAPEPSFSSSTETKKLENGECIKVIVPNPNGLHARPVAYLIQEASQYDCEIQIRNLTNGKGPVSIKSMTGIVALEALRGNEIELIAKGNDSHIALTELKSKIESGLGDSLDENTQTNCNKSTEKSESNNIFISKPIGISKGIVISNAIYPESRSFTIPQDRVIDTEREIDKLKSALKITSEILKEKSASLSNQLGKEHGDIFNAQSIVLSDPVLLDNAIELISKNKFNAAQAWQQSITSAIQQYKNLNDKNLQQRALDLQDVSFLVLQQLGIEINDNLDIREKGIIIVEDITPGQVTGLDKDKVEGIICLENGPTSHSSILLRSRGIPAIVQAKYNAISLSKLPDPSLLVMNGETGDIIVNPSMDELALAKKEKDELVQQELINKQESFKPALTLDNKSIDVFANIGRKEDCIIASENGAEGVGLLRTEFMFIDREKAPSEEEQIASLTSILSPMKDKTIIIRTLDAGGDKELSYLNMPKEANPFLGVRAIRLCLRNPTLFQQQLRAILRISVEFNVQIMFPMISTLEELQQAKKALEKAHNSLTEENIPHIWPIKTGMMMEVPSAAIMAHTFVSEVDFVSIGTNDLVQYTMAADRGNPELQNTLGKGFSPAVIELIKHICKSALEQNIPVAVCGESAANPELASILLGLGVTELSMNSGSIPFMKQWIRNQSIAELSKNI